MILIKNGHLIDPGANRDGAFDILIERGKVASVEPRGGFASLQGATSIDATGKLVIPGCIDLHVHLREPGFEWKETVQTGSEAAVLGGYTTICCMPNTSPVNDHAEVAEFIRRKSEAAGRARVLPIGAVTRGLAGKELSGLTELYRAGCVAFSDDGEPVHDAGLMRRALEWCSMWGIPISCHEEDKALSCGGVVHDSPRAYRLGLAGWHPVAEEVMIARDIELARACNARVHFCHVSTARGVELIRRAKNDGIPVTAEVTPHHLMLSEGDVDEYDTNAKMNPPLREAADREALRKGLADGTIDAVASDHAPHDLDSKRVEFGRAAFGIIGLQSSLPLLLELAEEGVLSRARAIEACTSGPARCFVLPDVGSLRPGSRADLSVVDPKATWSFSRESVRSKSLNSPFLDRTMRGRAETVLVGGEIVVENGALTTR